MLWVCSLARQPAAAGHSTFITALGLQYCVYYVIKGSIDAGLADAGMIADALAESWRGSRPPSMQAA